jgi:hypothetical protein
MLTLLLLLALMAFAVAIAAAIGKAPLWVAVILLSLALLLQTVPIR